MDLQEAIKICHSSTSKKYISENNITQEQVFEAVDMLCEFVQGYLDFTNRVEDIDCVKDSSGILNGFYSIHEV